MKRLHVLLAGSFVLTAFVARGVAEEPAIDASKLEPEKAFGLGVDPDGDCRIEQRAAAVTIQVPGTHHDLTHTKKYTKMNAPRVLKELVGDFTLGAQLDKFPLPGSSESSGGDHAFRSGGLLVWHDKDNFARLERAAVSGRDQTFLWLEIFRDARATVQKLRPTNDKIVWMRVNRQADTIVFSSSENGQEWREIHELKTELPAKLQVGFAAVNSTAGEHKVSFRDVMLSQP